MQKTQQKITIIRPYLIMFLSAVLRAYYVNYISIYKMQHDGGFPYGLTGHLSYVTYLMSTGHLPDFDPRTADQFWHPPLHHLLSAGLLKACWRVFPKTQGNLEIMQLLPFLYITAVIWLVFKILQVYAPDADPAVRDAILAFVAFQPTFVILSASVNNDTLALLMSVLVIYAALRWYRKPDLQHAALVGLALGTGLSVKLAVGLMFIPAAFLVLLKSIRDRRIPWKDMGVVAAVGLPIGTWWYFRNLIRFGVPLNFIWNIENGESYAQYLGDMSAGERLLYFDLRQFSYKNTYMQYEGEFLERNPLTGLIKTAALELWSWTYSDGGFKKVSCALMLVMAAFTLMTAAGAVQFLLAGEKDRVQMDLIERATVLCLLAANLVSYYLFCFRYPYVWSMDIRYVETIILAAAFMLLSLSGRHVLFKNLIRLLVLAQVMLVCVFFAAAPRYIL